MFPVLIIKKMKFLSFSLTFNLQGMNISEDISFGHEIVHLEARGHFLPERYFGMTTDFVRFKLYRITANGTYEVRINHH